MWGTTKSGQSKIGYLKDPTKFCNSCEKTDLKGWIGYYKITFKNESSGL